MKFEFVEKKENRLPNVGEWFTYKGDNSLFIWNSLFIRIPNEQGKEALSHSSDVGKIYMVTLQHDNLYVGRVEFDQISVVEDQIIIVEPTETVKLKRKES